MQLTLNGQERYIVGKRGVYGVLSLLKRAWDSCGKSEVPAERERLVGVGGQQEKGEAYEQ